jgi:hypothetical protein
MIPSKPVEVGPAQRLMGVWLAQFPSSVRPPEDDIRKQAAVARRLAERYDEHQIEMIVAAIPVTFPFSSGSPFDVMTIERWAPRLLVAGSALRMGGADRALARGATMSRYLKGSEE